MLFVTALAKAALTSVTFGLKLPAGVFLPTMAIGACFGRAVGLIMARWQRSYPGLRMFASCPADGPCISPPVYAVIGAASALGGATRMTISLVAILFELSGAVDLTLQIMMSCMVRLVRLSRLGAWWQGLEAHSTIRFRWRNLLVSVVFCHILSVSFILICSKCSGDFFSRDGIYGEIFYWDLF
jgi:H+/Cl- antiporter ClcA